MTDYLYYASLGMIVFLFVLSTVIYKKLRIWKLILVILMMAIFVIVEFFSSLVTFISENDLQSYFSYLVYLIVIVLAIFFRNKIKVTQNLTDYDFFELEKELESIRDSSDLLRKRFIHTIGLLNEGLVFYDDDLSGLFLSDEITDILEIDNPQLTIEEFKNHIHPEDQNAYMQSIKKVGKKLPDLLHKYRIRAGSHYTWVEEKGKLFTHKNKYYLISTLTKIDIKLYPKTSIQIVDSLPLEDELTNTLSQLRKEKKPFYLAMMHLTNVPDINKRFGRDVGNLMIAEYIKQMRYHFARENNTIFRITGIQFAVIISDEQKYANLNRALVSGGDLINVRINIGGIVQVVYPNIGIVKNDPWQTIEISEFISLSNKALEEAIRNSKQNYSIFGG
jgi:GGDEF domain-containing protein